MCDYALMLIDVYYAQNCAGIMYASLPPTLHNCHPYFELVCVCKVQSMDDNCVEWVECMGVASGCA